MVANDAGHRVTPTAVGWNGDEILTGLSAKQFEGRNPTAIVGKGNKSILGKPADDEASFNTLDIYLGGPHKNVVLSLALGRRPDVRQIRA